MAFPDVVELVVAYLDGILSVPVGTRVAKPRPARFVQVRRVGGAALAPVRDRARLDVIAWASGDEGEPDAMATALEARAAIWALAGTALLGPMTYSVSEFMAPRQADDSLEGVHQVWATYELAVRADDVIHIAPTVS